jgi:restriction system protein
MEVYNPIEANTTDMTDTEFEKYVANLVKQMSEKEGIKCSVKHNYIARVNDGNYQIDVIVEYTFLGGQFIILVECKKYKNPVPREKVEILYNRIRSIGAHKGMLFSTSRFQQGAIDFAKKHGIALVQVIDGKLLYNVKSVNIEKVEIPPWANLPKHCGVMVSKTSNGIRCSFITKEHDDAIINFLMN